MKIAILGNNDIAAHVYRACFDYGGLDIQVRTSKFEDPTDSAWWYQWLPESIMQEPDEVIIYQLGKNRPYLERQWYRWDQTWMAEFSPEPKTANGYYPPSVWDKLWEGAEIDLTLPMSDTDIADLARGFDIVFMCFPTQAALKYQSRFFRFPVVKIPRGEALNFVPDSWKEMNYNWLLMNGLDNHKYLWIRMSYLWNELFIEFPEKTDLKAVYPIPLPGSKTFYREEVHPNANQWFHSPAPNVYLMGKFANYAPKMTRQTEYYRTFKILEGTWQPEPYQFSLPIASFEPAENVAEQEISQYHKDALAAEKENNDET